MQVSYWLPIYRVELRVVAQCQNRRQRTLAILLVLPYLVEHLDRLEYIGRHGIHVEYCRQLLENKSPPLMGR